MHSNAVGCSVAGGLRFGWDHTVLLWSPSQRLYAKSILLCYN